jgi:transposase
MGYQNEQRELMMTPVNIFSVIPQDHVVRKLNKVLDLSFVRKEVEGFYGLNGQEGVDPVVLMKMMLLLFLDDHKSERQLMREIPLRIDYLYFLGYELGAAIPNHSVLSKARQRWGGQVFVSLFTRTVQQCLKAGLIDGRKLHMDGSLVRADASLNSVVQITLEKLDEKQEQSKPSAASARSQEVSKDKRPVNKRFQVETDPEATLVRHGQGKSLPSYKVHRGIDDKFGVTTAVETTTGAVAESDKLPELVQQHQKHTGIKPKAVVADAGYGVSQNFIAMAKAGIRSHMADLRLKQNNVRQQGIYHADTFDYDPQKDRYRCKAGRYLRRHHQVKDRGYAEYRTRTGVCSKCRLQHLCTRAKAGRTLKRYENQQLLDRARGQSHGPAAKKDRQKRKWMMEGNFGRGAVEHGMKRSRWRGLERQRVQDLLICAIQNLKILIRKGPCWLKNVFSMWVECWGGLFPVYLPRKTTFAQKMIPLLKNKKVQDWSEIPLFGQQPVKE